MPKRFIINPHTGRKIKVGGPTHKKLMRYYGGVDSQDISNLGTSATDFFTKILEKAGVPGVAELNKLGFALGHLISEKSSKLAPSLKAQEEGVDVFGNNQGYITNYPHVEEDIYENGKKYGNNIARRYPKGGDLLGKEFPELIEMFPELKGHSNDAYYGNQYHQRDIEWAHQSYATNHGY